MFFSNCLQLKLFLLRTASLSRQSTSSFSRKDILMRKNKHPVGFSALPGWLYLRGTNMSYYRVTHPMTVQRTVQLCCKWGWSLAIQCASNGVLVPGGKLLTTSLIILRVFHGFAVISKDIDAKSNDFDAKSRVCPKSKILRSKNFQDKKSGGKSFSHIFIVLGENKFSLQYVVKIPSGAGDTPIATSSKVDVNPQKTSRSSDMAVQLQISTQPCLTLRLRLDLV